MKKKFLVLIIFFILISFLIIFNYLNKNFLIPFYIYKEIDIKEFLQEDKEDPGWFNTFSPLIDSQGRLSSGGIQKGNITPQTPAISEFLFNKEVSFDGFSFFFYGNLHSISSALAKDFSIYILNEDNEWILLKKIEGNNSPFFRFISKKEITTKGIRIIFHSAYYENSIWYKNFQFLKKEKVNLIKKIKISIWEKSQTIPFYWLYYFLFFFIIFLPGIVFFSFLEKLKKIKMDSELKFIFSPIIFIILVFLNTIFYLLTGIKLILNIYLGILIISFILFLKFKEYKFFWKVKIPLVFLFLPIFINFLTISRRDYLFNMQYIGREIDSLKPIPTQEVYIGYFADNLFPWRLARAYLNRMSLFAKETRDFLIDTNFFDRTPLLPFITVFILNIFGEGHFVYQRFLEILGVLIYPAFYFLIKSHFSKRIALITLFLMLLNIQISFMPFNAEYFYKYFAIYPLILFLIFIFKKEKNKLSIIIDGGLIAISFLIHPYTIFIIGAIILLFLFQKRKKDFIIFIPTIVLFGIWLILPKIVFWLGYPKEQLLYLNLYKSRLQGLTFFSLLKNKLIGLIYLLIPNVLLKGVHTEKISIFSKEFLFEFFRYSLISNLSPLFFLLFIKNILKEKFKKNLEFIVLAIFPLIIFWFIHINSYNQAFNYGGFYFHFYTFIVPLLISYVVYKLDKNYISKTSKIKIFGSYLAFMAFNLWYISGNFVAMKCASIVVNILFWMIILTYAFLSLTLLKLVNK